MNRFLGLLSFVMLLLSACSDPETDYDALCADLEPTGNTIDDVAENWTLEDAEGNPHSLHDFCGKVIYLKIGARW